MLGRLSEASVAIRASDVRRIEKEHQLTSPVFMPRPDKSRSAQADPQADSAPVPSAETIPKMNALKSLFILLRPKQWIKNGFVLMPLIFSGHLVSPTDMLSVAYMFIAFCLVSSITYIINDYADMEQDRVHPTKRFRPLASGALRPAAAWMSIAALTGVVLAMELLGAIPPAGLIFLAGYVALHLAYSFKLKNVVILDVLAIAIGFLLRVLAGAVAIDVSVSSWLVMCTFSLAIFLALGKRRHEVVILCGDAACHRPVLDNYSVPLLDQLLQIVTTSTFIFYCLYTVRGNPALGIESEKMMFTIPLVTYGIFRYLYLIYHRKEGGSPTTVLLYDAPLLITTMVWLAACVAIIYS